VNGIRLHATVAAPVSAEELARLPFDFERYVAAEPRLRSARWLHGDDPGVGAEAEVLAEIPFTVPLVGRLLGAPEAHVTVTAWDPPRASGVDFSGRHFTGNATVTLTAVTGGCVVEIDGTITARSRAAAALLRPLTPLLEHRATQALERGVTRAVAYLQAERSPEP
jgi:hypothetical protein